MKNVNAEDRAEYIFEIMHLIETGYDRTAIVEAMKKFGLTSGDILREYDERRETTKQWLSGLI